MRVYEFILVEAIGRGKPISLRWLNNEKNTEKARMRSHEKRAKLLPIMYAQENQHDLRLKQIELEKEELELKRLQAEYDQLIIEPMIKSSEAIKRLSRSAMRKRKKINSNITNR